MRTVGIVGLVVVGLVALAFAGGLLIRPEWRVERSVVVNAPPASIYPFLASFQHGWSAWNPWAEADMKITYSGPDEGVGATQTWEGGDTNGGTIRITKADPAAGVEFALAFGPFPIDGRIAMSPMDGGATRLTWTDTGRISGLPVYRYMRFMLDRFVGQPMDRGLATLKAKAEAQGAARGD